LASCRRPVSFRAASSFLAASPFAAFWTHGGKVSDLLAAERLFAEHQFIQGMPMESFGLVAVGFLNCGFMLYVLFEWTRDEIGKPKRALHDVVLEPSIVLKFPNDGFQDRRIMYY
jgi:hypothetical protein